MKTTRKWNGFVCPDCRHVFRVARNHDGKGVVCPSCRRMLRLPGEDDGVPPLVIPGPLPDESRTISRDPGEAASGDMPMVKKRRRKKNHRKDEVFDETFSRKQEIDPKVVRGIIGSVGVIGAIVLAALLWPRGGDPEPEVTILPPPPPANDEKEVVRSVEDLAAEREVVRPTLVEDELVPVIRRFLEAKTTGEMRPWVRHPDQTLPRIEAFHADGLDPVGFSRVIWGQPPVRTGDSIRVTIQDGEFSRRNIHLVEEDGWKVDWESWEGWSELPWDELKGERPTEPVLFRVVVSDVNYYNFHFVDEAQWACYRLESREGEHSVYGYVPRAGILDVRLKSLERIKNRLFTLKLRYPEDTATANQVIIEEIVTDGWMVHDES